MKRIMAVAALAFAVLAAGIAPGDARKAQSVVTGPAAFRTPLVHPPLNYRFPLAQRPHAHAHRTHRHGWRHRHRHRHFQPFPALAGPAVIYQSGEVRVVPEEDDYTGAVPQPPALPVHPVIHRIGVSGGCDLQRANVPGSRGRTTVNVWRC